MQNQSLLLANRANRLALQASFRESVSSQLDRKRKTGIRIEPPPSLAPAIGTIPEATALAAPPLDPPE